MFAPGPPPPGLGKLCSRLARGSRAKPAGAPTGAPTGQHDATAPTAVPGAVLLAGAGLYGAHRLLRRVAAGDLPGRAGRWVVYKMADVSGKHINDLAALSATVDKIVEPGSVFNPRGIEGAVVDREGFNSAKKLMDDEWYLDHYPHQRTRAEVALAHQGGTKLNDISDLLDL